MGIKSVRTNLKIYLAGRLTPDDWRFKILNWDQFPDLKLDDISEDPLQSITSDLQDVITHSSASLPHGQMATLVGTIVRIKRCATKKGDEMAFVGLSDLDGLVRVAIFPRIWKETQKKWQLGKVVGVRGRIDSKGKNEPEIVCEAVVDQVEIVRRITTDSRDTANSTEAMGRWPILRQAIFGVHDYTGPFFTKRQGGWHSMARIHLWQYDEMEECPEKDGCNNHHQCDDCNIDEFEQLRSTERFRLKIKARCLDAIDRSDAVFAWLDDREAYGTLVEIGYACAKGKIVWVASDNHKIENDLWFASLVANRHYFSFPEGRPDEALKVILEGDGYETELSLCESPIEQMFWDKAKTEINGLVPQYKIDGGRYRLDFAVPDLKVAVELDGHEYHKTKEQRTKDAKRDRYLQMNGWQVIRFTGSEIYRDVDQCLKQALKIIHTIKAAHS